MNRYGFYFSFDALLALSMLGIITVFLLGTSSPINSDLETTTTAYRHANAVAEDATQLAIRSTVAEAFSPGFVQDYINDTTLDPEDKNKNVLTVIAILWASNETAVAQNMTATFFNNTIGPEYGYRLAMKDTSWATVYNTSTKPDDAAFVATAHRLVSGIERDKPTTGFIARASLQQSTKQTEKNVFYGGYVGDGNITSNVTLPDLHTVQNVTLEGDFSGPFTLSFNGADAGSYTPTSTNLTADAFHICSQTVNKGRCDALQPGHNRIKINFTGDNQSIGGGFLNIRFNRTTGLQTEADQYTIKEDRFPGVDGVINQFSSFYVPGTLHGLEAVLHYTSDLGTVFLTVGNATVYESDADGEVTVTISNSSMFSNLSAAGLSYDALSASTVPLRLGVTRQSLRTGEAGAIDAVATTDLSGSMDSQCSGGGGSQCKLKKAKNATKEFIDIILGTPDARVGLTGFNDFIRSYHHLDTNGTALKNEVDAYDSNGGTCVGCGIIRSVNTLIMRKLPIPIFSRGSQWKYTTGTASGTGWTTAGFDDSGWSNVTTPAGAGGAAVSQIADAAVYRFRKTFTFKADDFYQPYLSLQHTGNVNVYLNGHSVFNSSMNHTGRYWDTSIGRWAESSGMWHRSTTNWLHNGSSWYFGQEEVNHYATGDNESGNLATPVLDLSSLSNTQLTFSHWHELKGSDTGYVEVNDGTGWTQLASYQSSSAGWQNESFDLSTYATDTARIRFRVETAARGKNDDEDGWFVDNVKVGGFRSQVLNRSLFNDGKNVIAVKLVAESQPFSNASINRSSFPGGIFVNVTETGAGIELDGSSTRGVFTSAVFDADEIVSWYANTTGVTVPENTNISFKYGVNSSGSWTYTGTLDELGNGRFFRFKAMLQSNSSDRSPVIHWFEANHSRYGTMFDAELVGDEVRTPSMLVVSDGKSNQLTDMVNVPDHDGDGDVDATDHAIEAGCRAQQEYRADVHTVAFGNNADLEELNLTAQCGGGNFYNATIDNLDEIYEAIAQAIITASFEGQQVQIEAGSVNQTLYPDSELRINYTPSQEPSFGTFSLVQQSPRFGGNITSPKNGSFTVPAGVTVTDAKVTSYSSNYWTDRVLVKNASDLFEYVFRLWQFGDTYSELGDPFSVHLPTDKITGGTNELQLDTAFSQTNRFGGSPDDRVIYTAEVKGSVGYGDAFEKSEGGTYTFETISGNVTITVGNSSDPWNTSNDATDDATRRLISKLDIDGDGVVDFSLNEEDMNIEAVKTGGIEWLWGPATASLEVWQR